MMVRGGADSVVVRRLCGHGKRVVREGESRKAGQRVQWRVSRGNGRVSECGVRWYLVDN